MTDDLAEQLLNRDQASSWCADHDPTGRFVCSRIQNHALDWHAGRNSAGGVQRWPAASTGEPDDHADYPVGTILVDPPTGRWAIRFTPGDNTGRGQHVWLAPAGVIADGTRVLHHVEVRGWEVAEARRWGRLADDKPPVEGDLRARCITALSEQVSEFISPNEFGGYDPHYEELVDIVLDVVRRELADLRASRLAWAIEADRLDVIATAAEYHTGPEECCDSECEHLHDDEGNFTGTGGDWCPHVEMRHATAEDAIEAHKVPLLEARIETLDREAADDAQFREAVAAALKVSPILSNAGLVSAIERLTRERDEARAETGRVREQARTMAQSSERFFRQLHEVRGVIQDHVGESMSPEVSTSQAVRSTLADLADAERRLEDTREEAEGWSVPASRPAIPADGGYNLTAVIVTKLQRAGVELSLEQRNFLPQIITDWVRAQAAPVSGSDTRADGSEYCAVEIWPSWANGWVRCCSGFGADGRCQYGHRRPGSSGTAEDTAPDGGQR